MNSNVVRECPSWAILKWGSSWEETNFVYHMFRFNAVTCRRLTSRLVISLSKRIFRLNSYVGIPDGKTMLSICCVFLFFFSGLHANSATVFVGHQAFLVGRRGVLHRDDWFLGAIAQRVRIVSLGATSWTRVAAQDGALAAAKGVSQNVACVEGRRFVVVLTEHAVLRRTVERITKLFNYFIHIYWFI